MQEFYGRLNSHTRGCICVCMCTRKWNGKFFLPLNYCRGYNSVCPTAVSHYWYLCILFL